MTPKPRKRKWTFKPRICAKCGKEYTPTAGTQRYCSKACGEESQKAAYKRWMDKQPKKPPRVAKKANCKVCGKEFKQKNSRHQYCSVTCRYATDKTFAKSNQPCWDCQRGTDKYHTACCWVRCFKPIPGWDAEPTQIASYNGDGKIIIDSYKIKSCPEFLRDEVKQHC